MILFYCIALHFQPDPRLQNAAIKRKQFATLCAYNSAVCDSIELFRNNVRCCCSCSRAAAVATACDFRYTSFPSFTHFDWAHLSSTEWVAYAYRLYQCNFSSIVFLGIPPREWNHQQQHHVCNDSKAKKETHKEAAEEKHWKNYWQHIQLFVDYYCVKIVKISIRFFPSILSGFRRLRLYECGMKIVWFFVLLSRSDYFFCWLFHYLSIFTVSEREPLCDELIKKPGWNEQANVMMFFVHFFRLFVHLEGYLRRWANLTTHLLMDYSNQVLQVDVPMRSKREWYLSQCTGKTCRFSRFVTPHHIITLWKSAVGGDMSSVLAPSN